MIDLGFELFPAVVRILTMTLVAAAAAGSTAFLYRWYSGEPSPEGIPILVGLSVIAIWLNTTATLQNTLIDDELIGQSAAAFTLGAFVIGTIGADIGRRTGDHLGSGLPSVRSMRTFDSDVGQLVRTAGRVIRVTVPEQVGDIDGYDPVSEELKAELAGTTFLFPRRLTVEQLRDRFVDRLKRDYDVGHVDVEFDADGTVSYLALGRRLAGVGQTLAPETVALAIRADPAFSAAPGDRVQIWTDDPEPERIVTGELRASVDDVVTVVVDEADAGLLREDLTYRILTLPSETQPEREFAAQLRTADETMARVEVEAGSDLVGRTVGSLGLTVAAIKRDGDVEAIPSNDRTFETGDVVYVVGRLDAIRTVDAQVRGFGAGASVVDQPEA